MTGPVTRRTFLAAALASSLPADDPVAFFVVGDTHYLADKSAPGKLDGRSLGTNTRLIETLNKLPGTAIPAAAGGGTVLAPRGVVHVGDCIDTGDKPDEPRQATEWAAFADGFGLTGKDGRLKVPVYEVHGNHDSPAGDGLAVKKIAQRNKARPGVTNVSDGGVHYSWDWGPVHFVNLGIVVGTAAGVRRKRRYGALGSLDFLVADLKAKVGASGRPVVITHHVDVLRYAQPGPVEDARAVKMEWDPADVAAYHSALSGYTVAAIFYGHTHARNVFRWDGSGKPAKTGVPAFNVDNGGHFSFRQQAFFYVEVRGGEVTAREYQTPDGWETGSWTATSWTAPVRAGKG